MEKLFTETFQPCPRPFQKTKDEFAEQISNELDEDVRGRSMELNIPLVSHPFMLSRRFTRKGHTMMTDETSK